MTNTMWPRHQSCVCGFFLIHGRSFAGTDFDRASLNKLRLSDWQNLCFHLCIAWIEMQTLSGEFTLRPPAGLL